MAVFQHEQLEVYRLAIEFMGNSVGMAARIPRQRWFMADQFLRAASSVPLNIAEGAAEFRAAEKARFYRIARRSTAECAACMDVLQVMGILAAEEVDSGKTKLLNVAGKLTRLVTGIEARDRKTVHPTPALALALAPAREVSTDDSA